MAVVVVAAVTQQGRRPSGQSNGSFSNVPFAWPVRAVPSEPGTSAGRAWMQGQEIRNYPARLPQVIPQPQPPSNVDVRSRELFQSSDTSPARTSRRPESFWASTRRAEFLGRVSMFLLFLTEVVVICPTLLAERELLQQVGPWSMSLRLSIASLRLLPMVVLVLSHFWQRIPGTHRCVISMRPTSSRPLRFLRLSIICLLYPEVRWGLAITLDMWYLLGTPLNQGITNTSSGMLLVSNIILCFMDTLTLISVLAFRTVEASEIELSTEPEVVHRPRSVKLAIPVQDGVEPTCAICLSDFEVDDDVLQLPCNHVFHSECVCRWLHRSRRCPMRCPQFVLPPEDPHVLHHQDGVDIVPVPDRNPSIAGRVQPVLVGNLMEHGLRAPSSQNPAPFVSVLPGEAQLPI